MEEWVASMHDDNQQEERMEKIEGMVRNLNSPSTRRRVESDRERKLILDHKAVQKIVQLVDNKDKFKERNIKFINCMSQVDPNYERALTCIMKLADAEAMPDMETGWPGANGLFDGIPNLNIDQLDKDLKFVLVEKAGGTVHTKVVNGMPKGGVCVYTDL